MCSCLQSDETSRYALKCLFHRFRCRRHFLFQKDFARFIQNAVVRPAIAEVQTNRELVSFENHVSIYPNSASLFHSRSPFLLRLERVDHWERIASRRRPAFSSHLVSTKLPANSCLHLDSRESALGSNILAGNVGKSERFVPAPTSAISALFTRTDTLPSLQPL